MSGPKTSLKRFKSVQVLHECLCGVSQGLSDNGQPFPGGGGRRLIAGQFAAFRFLPLATESSAQFSFVGQPLSIIQQGYGTTPRDRLAR